MPEWTPASRLAQAVEQTLDEYLTLLAEEDVTNLHPMVMEQVESALIRYILIRTDGNRARAARLLGINRNTLYRKITHYRLDQS